MGWESGIACMDAHWYFEFLCHFCGILVLLLLSLLIALCLHLSERTLPLEQGQGADQQNDTEVCSGC